MIEATVHFSLTLLDLVASQHSLLIFTPVYDGDYRIDRGEGCLSTSRLSNGTVLWGPATLGGAFSASHKF